MKLIKSNYVKSVILAFFLIGLTACSDGEADIELSISTNPHWGTLMFDLQAVNDNAVIENVIINRGSCKLSSVTSTEISKKIDLKFGETYRGYSSSCSVKDIKEVEVTTGKGTFVFSF